MLKQESYEKKSEYFSILNERKLNKIKNTSKTKVKVL